MVNLGLFLCASGMKKKTGLMKADIEQEAHIDF